MEGVRHKDRGAEGPLHRRPHDYEQIPALVDRSVLRAKNFLTD